MIVLGAMSGSSLDGLDLTLIQFDFNEDARLPTWEFLNCSTIPYPAGLQQQLKVAPKMSGYDLYLLEASFSQYVADEVQKFISDSNVSPTLIGWHGHTIFHNPAQNTSLQIGKGSAIAALTGVDVVCDFRLKDLALGGQGAPLAPLADLELLPTASFYINLGGICNMTVRPDNSSMLAADLSVCNQLLNYASQQLGKPYDDAGAMARTGACISDLRAALNNLPYHSQSFPKSLDNNWVTKEILPLAEPYLHRAEDVLYTGVVHIVDQLEIAIKEFSSTSEQTMLCTGGGAKNTFLIEELSARLKPHDIQVILPSDDVIEFKEALLMAYMAVCHRRGRRNVIATVTGATQDSIGGCLHLGVNPPAHA